jgi:hypothetical protein
MMAANLASKVVYVGSFPSKIGSPKGESPTKAELHTKQKEAARKASLAKATPRSAAENDLSPNSARSCRLQAFVSY